MLICPYTNSIDPRVTPSTISFQNRSIPKKCPAVLAVKPEMEEALGRMERGEDPEKIEEEMGDLLDSDDLFSLEGMGRQSTPRVDETLYDL